MEQGPPDPRRPLPHHQHQHQQQPAVGRTREHPDRRSQADHAASGSSSVPHDNPPTAGRIREHPDRRMGSSSSSAQPGPPPPASGGGRGYEHPPPAGRVREHPDRAYGGVASSREHPDRHRVPAGSLPQGAGPARAYEHPDRHVGSSSGVQPPGRSYEHPDRGYGGRPYNPAAAAAAAGPGSYGRQPAGGLQQWGGHQQQQQPQWGGHQPQQAPQWGGHHQPQHQQQPQWGGPQQQQQQQQQQQHQQPSFGPAGSTGYAGSSSMGGGARMFRGEHSGGVAADRAAPYSSQQSRFGGGGGGGGSGSGGGALQPLRIGQQEMVAVLAGSPHHYEQAHSSGSSSSGSSQALARRPNFGTVADKELTVLANLYRLTTVSAQQLYHFDVTFQRSSRAQQPAGALPRRPPDNAREIMAACIEQYWRDDQGRPLQEAWAFDGSRNLVTPRPVRVRGGVELPRDKHSKLQLEVRDVPVPGKSRTANWQVSFQLVRVLTDVQQFQLVSNRLTELLAAGQDTSELLQFVSETRQPLEWVLKQAFVHAQRSVMELGRILYFPDSAGNRNIGGGLRAITGLLTGVKLGQRAPLLVADLTTSAFLRDDINLVQFLAEVAGCHMRGGGFGGRDGGGRGGGGRGRAVPEVGPPDVDMLLQRLQHADVRRRLLHKFGMTLRNKKLVYRDNAGNVIRKCTAVGLLEPADRAMFYCRYKQPIDGREGEEMSVAAYYHHVLNQPLRHPQLPVVEMKTPKPKEGEMQRQLWIPMERLSFDKNQRVQAVTHPGGVEQMIEAARKQPADLAAAIQQPVSQATGTSSSKQALQGMGVAVDSSMQSIKARVLPGPRLTYREGPAGREEAKAFNTGRQGQWNMQRMKFAAPARLRSGNWGLVAFLPRREYDGPQQQRTSLAAWVFDLVNRFNSLGIDLDLSGGREAPEVAIRQLRDHLMRNMVWLEREEGTTCADIEQALRTARERAGGASCQLIMCFIRQKPSPLYSRIKVVSELVTATGGLGLVTQVVVANKTDLGARGAKGSSNQRSQYQANVALKVNAKVGGVNTHWSVLGQELLRQYFNREVPPIQVFGIDVSHPGKTAGARSKAAVVGSLDPAFCRYAQSYWEEESSGSEVLSKERVQAAFRDLIRRYYTANNGRRPGCLLVYRDGVSDSELQSVRTDEVASILAACRELSADYRPRIVYVVVQKRHHVRLFDASRAPGELQNLEPGTVIDHTIVSPAVHDFYLNSHKEIRNTGTSRSARYICLLDELGLGADGLQVLTYWLCYLYCRCTRSVSVVAPVYYAHLLAYRVRVLDEGDDSASLASGSSGAASGQPEGASLMRHGPRYHESLADTMFFV